MSKSDNRIRTSKRNFLIALTLLLVTNVLTSITLMSMAKRSLREQIEQRMLDITNTAASQINGDILRELKAEDKGTENYEKILDILRVYQDNIKLDYIYGINPEDDGTFTFTIDPTVDDPGEFGEPIVATDALRNAANGEADVDDVPYTDKWGTFYSAYSPVYDSNNDVVGIIAVDFDAKWFNSRLNSNKIAALILTMAALTVGIALAFAIMSRNRKRFAGMMKNLDDINKRMKHLDDIIMQSSVKKLDMLPESENTLLKTLASGELAKHEFHDEFDEVDSSIDEIYQRLDKYIRYVDSEVYTDDTTGVNNKAAYKMRYKEIDKSISGGNASFSVAFFDINELKRIYVHQGFETAERLMYECAKILCNIFGKNEVYHVTGDEFIVLADKKSILDMDELFAKFDKKIQEYNLNKDVDHQLSVAKGFQTFSADKHNSYRSVFVEAKHKSDADKAAHYKNKE